jgi:hypothetical protein
MLLARMMPISRVATKVRDAPFVDVCSLSKAAELTNGVDACCMLGMNTIAVCY